jgi:gliding motility-associated-like protein
MKTNIKTISLSLFLFLFSFNIAYSQCTTDIRAERDTIACGEELLLTNIPPLSGNGADFASGTLDPAFWDLGLSNFTNMIGATNCFQPPTSLCSNPVPSAPLFWFPGGSPGNLTTQPLDITCGGTISFDYRQETQSSAPCDGPDQANEGLNFQYQNGAGPWTAIFYFLPTFSGGPASYQCWNNYSYAIPAGAIGPNTRFRWFTSNTSSAGWDQWGMDNISISQPAPCGNPYITTWFGPNVPANYNFDTITVSPFSDSAIYSVSVTNGVNTCTDSFTVYVEQPSIISSTISAACAGSDTLNTQATIVANCYYRLELWNYLPGGVTQAGWGTGATPQTYHELDIIINGSFYNAYSVSTGMNFTNISQLIPVTDGDQLDGVFSSLGSAANECFYEVYDSQNNLLVTQGFIASVPGNFSIPVTCPATATYNYSWQNLTSGGGSGLNNPNIQNPLATVAVITQFEVTAYDSLNPQCIAIDTVTVLPNANPISATLTGDTAICTGDPLILNFVLFGGAPFDVEILITPTSGLPTNVTYQLNASGLINSGSAIGTPITFFPTQNTTYSILSILDNTGCPASVTNPTLIVEVNDPPNAGSVINNPITLCKNDGTDLYLPNNLSGSPDLNGTWSFLGVPIPFSGLPFNGFNYMLDPALFPTTATGVYHTFQYEVSPLPGCLTPSISQIQVAIEDAPSAGILPANSIQICLDGTFIDLNSLFNCPTCVQPSPFTGLNWTDVTGGLPGTIINTPTTWTPVSSGTYTMRYTADVSINCPSTDFEEITIIVSDIPTATFSTNAIADEACLNDNVNLIFSPTGLGNFQIQYFDPGGTSNLVTVDINSNDIGTGLPISIPTNVAGTFNYSIQDIVDLGTGATACTGSAYTDVNLLVTDPPQSGTTTSNTICEDDFTLHNLNNPPFFPTGGDAGGAWTYGMNPVTSGLFQASDNLGNINDPFGAYTYTVTDVLGICPDEFTNITITAETPPNTGIANTNIEICVNDISITNYDLFGLLDGSQGITGSWVHNGIVVANPIDLTSPIFDLGTPAISTAFSFTYQLVPAPLSFCTNNGSLPYSTSSNITIHPEPKIDPTTPTANPLTVFQTLSTNIFVNMLEGTPPFTVNLLGNETPLGIYLPFVINPGMSGSGPVTPNYDINNNPVTISITSITDGNNCTSIPVGATVDVTVEPFPIITASSSNIEQCEGLPLDIIFEGIQGIPTIDIDFLINGTTYYTATSALNGITILNTPTSSDISSLLSIGSNLIQVINVVDAGGNICPNSLLPPNFTIIINENPSFSNFSSNSPICENENAEISFNINSGLAPFTIDYNYSINSFPLSPPLSQITTNATHMEVLLLLPEDYTFFITSFTDDNGCIGILPPNINLIVNETPIITLNSFIPTEICEGNTIPLNLQTPINLSTPAVPYTLVINGTDSYLINNNATIFSGPNIGNLITYTENNPGIYPFIITEFYDDNGCGIIDPANNSATLTVNESADMIVTSTADTGEICQGDLAYINFEFTNGTAPWEVTFIKNGIPIILPPYNNSITIPQSLYTYNTSYDIISLKDAKGCNKDPFDKDFEIIANPLPIAELYTDDRFICDDGSTTEMMFTINSGTPAYNVSYSIGLENNFLNINTNSTPLALNTNRAGIWQITEVVDSKGCIADKKGNKITISLNPSPFASFVAYPQPTDVNNPFVNFIDNSIGHSNAVWNFYDNITNDTIGNNSKFIHDFSAIADTHLVTLNIISDSGCVSSITQSIFINEAFSCFIPSGFTPNNDLYNDHFLPITSGVTDYKLSIYDRLGSRVFETNKYTDMYCMYGCDQAWDGKINNSSEYAPTGNYVYNIVIIDFNGKERVFDGTVNLIR